MAKAETKAQLKDMKKAIDSLQEGVTKLETRVDRHETRLDRIEKSTQLVVEFAPDLETIYQQAQVTREFKNLCKDGAAAVLKALGHVLHLPYPIPSDQSSSDWHKANPDLQSSAVVDQWYMLCPALEHSTRFISPNRTRGTFDDASQSWIRAKNHFVLRLEFGLASQTIQDVLAHELGKALLSSRQKAKDDGAGDNDVINVFINRTREEIQKRNRPGPKGKGKQHKGKGKGRGGGKGNAQ